MDLMPSIDAPHEIFGVEAIVTPRGGDPVETTVIEVPWDPPAVGDLMMSAASAVKLRRALSIRRSAVPALPLGSTVAANLGNGPRTYRVDRIDDGIPDEWVVLVTVIPETPS